MQSKINSQTAYSYIITLKLDAATPHQEWEKDSPREHFYPSGKCLQLLSFSATLDTTGIIPSLQR